MTISHKLLKEVLGIQAEHFDYERRDNILVILVKDGSQHLEVLSINIHELMSKVKMWAYGEQGEKGKSIMSGVSTNLSAKPYVAYIKETGKENSKDFYADTEIQAVLNAGEYILHTSDSMHIKVLYAKHYIKREMFLITINGKYTRVYKGSGLNGGAFRRILPYRTIEPNINSIHAAPGYIYKECLYEGKTVHHAKEPSTIYAEKLIEALEGSLDTYEVPIVPYVTKEDMSTLEYYEEFCRQAQTINDEMDKIIAENDYEEFDWADNPLKG